MEKRSSTARRRCRSGLLAAGVASAAVALSAASAVAAERAYELVTPADSLAQIETPGGFTNDDGTRVFVVSGDSLPGSVPNGPLPTLDSYMFVRGANGWQTQWVTDAPDAEPGTAGSMTMYSTPDGVRQLMFTENSIDPADTRAHSMDGYLRTVLPDGTTSKVWVTPVPEGVTASRTAIAASADLGRFLVQSSGKLVPEDTDSRSDLYLADADGDLRLLTPSPGANNIIRVPVGGNRAAAGAFGADGSYGYFSSSQDAFSPDDTDVRREDVYRWDADGSFTLISRHQNPAPPTEDAATFVAASDDGDVVCYSTAMSMLAEDTDAGTDVYCLTLSTDELDLASAGTGPADDLPATGLTISQDGRSVVFVSESELADEDDDNGLSLYVRRAGRTVYVSPLDAAADMGPSHVASFESHKRGLRVSPDGASVLFVTAAAADAGDLNGQPDVYRWQLGDGLDRVSAGNDGIATIGLTSSFPEFIFTQDARTGRVVTSDFETVFFESTAALVLGDTDGGRIDVYEWTEAGGVRQLSPPGDANYEALYVDNSSDGSTVFFVTAEAVLPQDVNGTRDLYAARVGGGFPVTPPPPPCTGDACQGESPRPPVTPRPATDGFSGPSDVDEAAPPWPTHRVLRISKANRRALVRKGRTAIRVRVTDAGTVALRATARMRGRQVAVGSSRVTARGSSTLRLPLRLSRRARAQLRSRGRLRLTLTIGYSESDTQIRRVVSLRG